MAAQTSMAAVFERLRGSWSIRRHLKSALPGFPSGIFEGTAAFTVRTPSAESVSAEYLYSEQGQLRTDTGHTLSANRKYIYRYSPDDDKISAWFVKESTKHLDGQEEVDYLFHDLEMNHTGQGWVGKGDHLCERDMYWAYYEFWLPPVIKPEIEMNIFGVQYKVKGPQKDYTSETAYQRE